MKFNRFLPIMVFLLMLICWLTVTTQTSNAQIVVGPGTITPAVQLKVDVEVPQQIVTGKSYTITVEIKNVHDTPAQVTVQADMNYTRFQHAGSDKQISQISSSSNITSSLAVQFEDVLEPGESFSMKIEGFQKLSGPVFGNITVKGSDPEGIAVNNVVDSLISWVAGYGGDFAISAKFLEENDIVTEGIDTMLRVNLNSTGVITEARALILLPEEWSYTGLFMLDHSERSMTIRHATHEDAEQLIAEHVAMVERWTAYEAATGNVVAASLKVDPPLVSSVEGNPMIFWTPFDEQDEIGVSLYVEPYRSASLATVRGRITASSGSLFFEDVNESDNFFELTQGVDFLFTFRELLPLVAR